MKKFWFILFTLIFLVFVAFNIVVLCNVIEQRDAYLEQMSEIQKQINELENHSEPFVNPALNALEDALEKYNKPLGYLTNQLVFLFFTLFFSTGLYSLLMYLLFKMQQIKNLNTDIMQRVHALELHKIPDNNANKSSIENKSTLIVKPKRILTEAEERILAGLEPF